MSPIMMIDGRNIMYRAVAACRAHNEHSALRGFNNKRHPLPLMMGLIGGWIRDYTPVSVQVYWDAPRATVWRRDIFPEYKNRESNIYGDDISSDDVEKIACEMFEWLNIRQFRKDRMEADDLLYAACRIQCNKELLICSSDSDLRQLLFMVPDLKIYDPNKKCLVTATESPILYKALMGDIADTVPGYVGVGPKTAAKLVADYGAMSTMLESKGKDTLVRNLKLIDLSMSPYTLQNQIWMLHALARPAQFDKEKLKEICKKYKFILSDLVELPLFRRLI